jgi:hypothetical protein
MGVMKHEELEHRNGMRYERCIVSKVLRLQYRKGATIAYI